MTADVIQFPTAPPAWDFGDYLRKARRARGMTQADMATQLGVGVKAYGAWEAGINEPRNLRQVAETLEQVTGYPRQWFMGWFGPSSPTPDGAPSEATPRSSDESDPSTSS